MMVGSAVRWIAAFSAVFWSAGIRTAMGQESLADLAVFREGCQALADERFESARDRFLECWKLLGERDSPGPENGFVAARLLETLARGGDADEAIDWFGEHEGAIDSGGHYWVAVAFQKAERYAEAASHYQVHLASAAAPRSDALLNLAVCLTRDGEGAQAHELLSAAPSPESPEERLRHAQIAAADGDHDDSFRIAGSLTFEEVGADLILPLMRLRAALQLHLGDRKAAAEVLYEGLEAAGDSETARRGFVLLEVLLGDDLPKDLAFRISEWEKKSGTPLAEVARLFRIILLGNPETRTADLRQFAGQTGDPALKLEAGVRLGEAAEGTPGIDPELLTRLDFAMADQAFRAGRFGEAAGLFSSFAELLSGESAARNRYNAAIAALRNNDPEEFARQEEACRASDPRSPYLVDLGYVGGLYFASRGEVAAFDRLNSFVLENPDHPANVNARLALAEIHLNQAPARPAAAREISESLATRPLTLAQSERLDYITIWIDLIEGNSSDLLRRAAEFVSSWPSSVYRAEVLMILASEHYRRKSRAEAAAIFHQVATEFPKSAFALPAKFFEAKSLPPEEATLERWRVLAGEGGPLSREAAHELALLLLSLDRFGEAREALEKLVQETGDTEPLHFAAMADLGYACYLEGLAGGRNSEALEEAAKRFTTLSNLVAAPAFWRYQASVRRGKCLEALGKDPVALEIYRSIVEETRSSGSPLSPSEAEWVFRAGFAAIELLGSTGDWATAIRIADTLSEKSGPRSIEATRLAERLRLQHWIWD